MLTCQLKKYCNDIEFVASDNNADEKTGMELGYAKIRKKAIFDVIYQIENDISPPDAIIVSWIDNAMIKELKKLIRLNKIKIIIVIHRKFNGDGMDIILNHSLDVGYYVKRLPILQMSYLDYFNKNVLNIKSQGSTTVLFNGQLKGTEMDTEKNLNFYKSKTYFIDKVVLQDSAMVGNIPLWMVTHEPYNDIKKVLYGMIRIPLWVPNMELLNFYLKKNKNKSKFPLNIDNESMLQDYYYLSESIRENDIGAKISFKSQQVKLNRRDR